MSEELDYTKLKADDLRELLIPIIGEEEAAKIKGKSALVEAHKRLTDDETDVVFEEISENIANDTVDEDIPNYFSTEWSKFVLSEMSEDELHDNKYPKLNGLRRVAEKYLGNIVSSGPVTLNTIADNSNMGRANCIYEVQFNWYVDTLGAFHSTPLEMKVFRAAGGASNVNVDDDLYQKFPEAMAESRAEARALRKALRIDCVTYEEMINGKEEHQFELPSVTNESNNTNIQPHQKIAIRSMCEKLSIDVEKFLKQPLEKLDYETAVKSIETLNSFQGTGKETQEIPGEIKK